MKSGLRQRLIGYMQKHYGLRLAIPTGNRELRKSIFRLIGKIQPSRQHDADIFLEKFLRLGPDDADEYGNPPWEGEPNFPPASPPRSVNFYESDLWRKARYQALKLHGGCCQCCGARASPGKPLHVDHIKPRSRFRHLELEVANLQVLCADCNLGKGAWDKTDWRAA